jgi:hypothetical protein
LAFALDTGRRCQKYGQQLIAQSDDVAMSPAIALPCSTPVERLCAMTLVVFDMDGTLLDAQSKISPFTSETLSLMRQNGIAYTIATGRTLQAALTPAR